jgi:hypothetical protein
MDPPGPCRARRPVPEGVSRCRDGLLPDVLRLVGFVPVAVRAEFGPDRERPAAVGLVAAVVHGHQGAVGGQPPGDRPSDAREALVTSAALPANAAMARSLWSWGRRSGVVGSGRAVGGGCGAGGVACSWGISGCVDLLAAGWVQHAAPTPRGLGRARRLHGRRRTAQAAWVAAPGGRTRAWRTPGLLAARESRCCAGPGRPAGQRRGRQRPRSPPAGPAGPVLAAGVEGQGGLGRGQPPGAGGRRPLRRGAHPPAGAAAPGIGCGEPCWCGPTAWSPGAASAPPPTHHPTGGVRRAVVRAPASVPRPRRRCAGVREVFALVQAPRGVGAACCAHQPATGSHATGGATSERATSRFRGHRPAAGCRPPDLASQRLLSVQLDQPAAVARLLRTIPEQ